MIDGIGRTFPRCCETLDGMHLTLPLVPNRVRTNYDSPLFVYTKSPTRECHDHTKVVFVKNLLREQNVTDIEIYSDPNGEIWWKTNTPEMQERIRYMTDSQILDYIINSEKSDI